jgi:hypothetical protein
MGRDFSYQRRCPLHVAATPGTPTMGLRESLGAAHSSQLAKPLEPSGTSEADEAMIRCFLASPRRLSRGWIWPSAM